MSPPALSDVLAAAGGDESALYRALRWCAAFEGHDWRLRRDWRALENKIARVFRAVEAA